ncbi:MAG: GC-type dockerin domain-anchored protein [Phycisphaerales bacterium]
MRIRTRRSIPASLLLALAGSPALAGGPMFSNTLGTPGMSGSYVASFSAYDDGSGEALYATGQFNAVGVAGTSNLAKWNGSAWESVGGGLINQYSNALTTFQGDLIAGGYFDSAGGVAGTEKLARWDGSAWHSMGAESSSFLNSIWDLVVWDDGTTGEQLYIAGNYVDIGGAGGPDHISKWDGTTYTEVGGTIGGAVPLIVLDLLVADLGDGEKLYASGRFLNIGGVPANNVAVWDGNTWAALGDGIRPTAGFAQGIHMVAWDDGNGMALYVGGSFGLAGGNPALRVAKWDGANWSPMGDGFDLTVQELVVFDDGSGEALYALGSFTHSGAAPVAHIARWNGSSWEQVGAGADGNVLGALVYDAGEGVGLQIGGGFANAGGLASSQVVTLLAQTSAGCNAADLAEPYGQLDFSDVVAFLVAFGNQDPAGDLAAPMGQWDFSDVVEFLTVYGGGCP